MCVSVCHLLVCLCLWVGYIPIAHFYRELLRQLVVEAMAACVPDEVEAVTEMSSNKLTRKQCRALFQQMKLEKKEIRKQEREERIHELLDQSEGNSRVGVTSQVLRSHHNKKNQTREEIVELIRSGVEDRLEARMVPGKVWGVFPKSSLFHMFHEGEYVCEYVGERISMEEGKKRQAEMEERGDNRCYIFEVEHRRKRFCIDATNDDGRMGRLINHSRLHPNLRRSTLDIDNDVHLVLFALRDIPHGEELLYDYNDRSKQARKDNPWLGTS